MRRTVTIALLALSGCGYRIGGPPSSEAGFTATHASVGKPGEPAPRLPADVRERLAALRP